jgi:hypothetical protein
MCVCVRVCESESQSNVSEWRCAWKAYDLRSGLNVSACVSACLFGSYSRVCAFSDGWPSLTVRVVPRGDGGGRPDNGTGSVAEALRIGLSGRSGRAGISPSRAEVELVAETISVTGVSTRTSGARIKVLRF